MFSRLDNNWIPLSHKLNLLKFCSCLVYYNFHGKQCGKILIIRVHLNFAPQQGKVANWKYLKVSRTLLLELIVKLSSSSQLWKTILLADQWPLLRDRVGTSVNQKSAMKILNRSQANMKSMCVLEETTPASWFQFYWI